MTSKKIPGQPIPGHMLVRAYADIETAWLYGVVIKGKRFRVHTERLSVNKETMRVFRSVSDADAYRLRMEEESGMDLYVRRLRLRDLWAASATVQKSLGVQVVRVDLSVMGKSGPLTLDVLSDGNRVMH